MTVKKILLLGDPKLYEISKEVKKEELKEIEKIALDLKDTMLDFKQRYGWGRAIAAPQIGIKKRVIYMHVEEPILFINPEMTLEGTDLMELWDDCMSFPDLLVRVKRYVRCQVKFKDLAWQNKELFFEFKMSELFQHEYDHLNGILAVERAINGKSFALTSQKEFLGLQEKM